MRKFHYLKFRHLLILAVTALVLLFAGCSSNKEKKKADASSETKLYEMAQNSLSAGNWVGAISSLQLLEEHFPFGTYGEQAQLELIYAYFRSDEYDSAIRTADRFIRLHPQHRHVGYAYYMKGLASFHEDASFLGSLFSTDNTNRDLGAARDSYNHFSQFISRFPESEYARDARQRMVYLRNILARYEIHVANYYFKRKSYLAAANRGRFVVENFQGAPAIPDGLAVMAQAYYLLELNELGDDAATVLAHNYPTHPALDKNGKFDRRYTERAKKRSWLSYATFGMLDKDEPLGFDTREIFDPLYVEEEKKLRPPHIKK